MVEHAVAPPSEGTRGDAPLVIGLTPGDESSVAPIGIPVGLTGEPGPIPSGDVKPSGGAPMPPTCAAAGPQPRSAAATMAVRKRVILDLSSSAPLPHEWGSHLGAIVTAQEAASETSGVAPARWELQTIATHEADDVFIGIAPSCPVLRRSRHGYGPRPADLKARRRCAFT